MNGLQKSFLSFVVLSAAFTVFSGIYMAQPWGDNYAYQNSEGYLQLFVFLVFAVSPYVGFILIPRALHGSSTAVSTSIVGGFLISAYGVYSMYQAAFASSDAQSGLVFIFLPIYQWLGAAVVGIISFAIKVGGSNA